MSNNEDNQSNLTNFIDASIYDDPNILLGQSESDCNDRYSQAKRRMKSVFDKLPPNGNSYEGAMRILINWTTSDDYKIWEQNFLHFINLRTKDYLWLISRLPDLLLKKIPQQNEKAYPLYKLMKDSYNASAEWLGHFTHPDRPMPSILATEAYQVFKPYADIKKARLDICQALLDYPSENFYSEIFCHAMNLFFWWEISQCKYNIKINGLAEPIACNQIMSKTDVTRNHLNIAAALSDSANAKLLPSTIIRGIEGHLNNLDSSILSRCRDIANLDSDFQDGPLKAYEAIFRTSARKIRRDPKYQGVYYYLALGKPELFITGQNTKLPSSNFPLRVEPEKQL